MMTRRILHTSVAASFLALIVAGAQIRTNAQQAVSIDNDDIGGVVTSAKGPEAGVWVIAETTEPADQARQDRRHRRSGTLCASRSAEGELQRLGARLRPGRFAEGAKRARQGPQPEGRRSRPNARAAAEYYPAGYWFSLMQRAGQERIPGHRREGQRHRSPTMRTQAEWLRSFKNGGCWGCHQLGNKATREIPKALGTFPSSAAAWDRRVQSGQAGGTDERRAERLRPAADSQRVRELDRSDRRRRSAGGAAAAAGASSATSSSRSGTGPIRKRTSTTRSSTDRRNPTVNANGSALRRPGTEQRLSSGARSREERYEPRRTDGARSEHPTGAGGDDAAAFAVLGRRSDLGQQEQRAQPDVRREGPGLDHVRRAPTGEPGVLQGRLEPSVREVVPDRDFGPAPRGLGSENPTADAHQHLLRHAPPDVRRGRQPHAVDERRRTGRRLVEHGRCSTRPATR